MEMIRVNDIYMDNTIRGASLGLFQVTKVKWETEIHLRFSNEHKSSKFSIDALKDDIYLGNLIDNQILQLVTSFKPVRK